jgi:hypothetical protein
MGIEGQALGSVANSMPVEQYTAVSYNASDL